MFERREPLFRKEALERLSSPERLDRVVSIVGPADWLLFLTLAAVIAGALLWSIFGVLPTTVTGHGILIRPPAGTRFGSLEMRDGTSALLSVSYFAVGDGKRIRPGMKIQVTPDTVRRERFGGIIGKVGSVSTFPATREGAAALVGNAEVIGRLLDGDLRIEVISELVPDPSTPSGFRWSSSRGPEIETSPGTTASSRVTVEERAPITYVLPFLRSLGGIY